MTADNSNLEAVVSRCARLERSNRRLQVGMLLLWAIPVAILLMGQGRPSSEKSDFDTVRARKFELVWDDKTLLEIFPLRDMEGKNPRPIVLMKDSDGRERIRIGIEDENLMTGFRCYDETKAVRMVLGYHGLADTCTPHLKLYGRNDPKAKFGRSYEVTPDGVYQTANGNRNRVASAGLPRTFRTSP